MGNGRGTPQLRMHHKRVEARASPSYTRPRHRRPGQAPAEHHRKQHGRPRHACQYHRYFVNFIRNVAGASPSYAHNHVLRGRGQPQLSIITGDTESRSTTQLLQCHPPRHSMGSGRPPPQPYTKFSLAVDATTWADGANPSALQVRARWWLHARKRTPHPRASHCKEASMQAPSCEHANDARGLVASRLHEVHLLLKPPINEEILLVRFGQGGTRVPP